MLPELRYVKELQKENERLVKQLGKKSLTRAQKAIIKQRIARNKTRIASITEEVAPIIEKISDCSKQKFIESYYLKNKSNVVAETDAESHYESENLKSICDRDLREFWKL